MHCMERQRVLSAFADIGRERNLLRRPVAGRHFGVHPSRTSTDP